MPLYEVIWKFVGKTFSLKIDQELIDYVFVISNSTPGVVSTKLAFFTGYIVAKGSIWAYFFVFITYLVFALPSIILMLYATKFFEKISKNKYLKNIVSLMKPIVAGIIFALIFQLFISLVYPQLRFNSSIDKYIHFDTEGAKSVFFTGWRLIAAGFFVPSIIVLSVIALKKRVPLFVILIAAIAIGLIVFMPWL